MIEPNQYQVGHPYRLLELIKPLYNVAKKSKTSWYVHLILTVTLRQGNDGKLEVRNRKAFIILQRANEQFKDRLRCQVGLSHLKEFVDLCDELYPLGRSRLDRRSKVKVYNPYLWQNLGRQLGKHKIVRADRADYEHIFEKENEP